MAADGSLPVPAAPALEGEILPPRDPAAAVRVVAAPKPFAFETVNLAVPAGLTIAEIVAKVFDAAGVPARAAAGAHVFLVDAAFKKEAVYVPRELWGKVRPKPGVTVTLRAVARGGRGKNPLRSILMIAVLVAAAWAAPYLTSLAFSGTFAGAGVAASAGALTTVGLVKAAIFGGLTMMGMLAVNAIAPPPTPKLGDLSGRSESTSPTLSITGASNKANPYGPVPRVLGTHRLYPPFAALPYTEVVGNDQYLRLLFDFGYGPLNLSDFRIGTTPLANFEGVEMEVREGRPGDAPHTLYPGRVAEDGHSILLTEAGGARTLESRSDADEITIDVAFAGLVRFDDQAKRHRREVQVRAEYRRAGTADPWIPLYDHENGAASTAVDLISVVGNVREYRTVLRVAGPVTVQLHPGPIIWGDGIFSFYRYRVYARAEGETAWVLHHTQRSPAVQSIAVVGAVGKRMEIRVETLNADEGGIGVGVGFYYLGYTEADYHTFGAATEQLVRKVIRIRPAARGRYEVRLTRLTPDTDDDKIRDKVTITTLRTITAAPPLAVTGHATVALRIKATDQLNGMVQQFSALAEALLETWDGTAWTAPVATDSLTAWQALTVLRDAANKRPVPDHRLDLAEWLAFAQECAAPAADGQPKWCFDAVVDSRRTVRELVNEILATARATLGTRDGKYYPVRDKRQVLPVQVFSPRNSWGFRATRLFVDLPHGIKVRYIEPARDWAQDEVIAYADGYSAANATLFEAVDMWGINRRAQAWREGRFRYAEAKARPWSYELHTDIEHLIAQRGALVMVQHDVVRWGLGDGRIVALARDAENAVTAITLDTPQTLAPGVPYGLRIRYKNGDQSVERIAGVNEPTETKTLLLETPIPAASAPEGGELCTFGERGLEATPLIVRNIRREGADHNARLELVDEAPGIHDADAGPAPAFEPRASFPGRGVNQAPTKPAIDAIRSDDAVLIAAPGGGWIAAIEVTLAPRAGDQRPTDYLEVQYRRAESGEAWTARTFPAPVGVVTLAPVAERQAYDLRLRYVRTDAVRPGLASDWTVPPVHVVIGQTAPPPPFARVLVENGRIIADYPNPPRDFLGARIEWKRGVDRVRSGATRAHATPTVALPFDMAALPPGILTIFVTAVDMSGNESAPAVLVREQVPPDLSSLVATVDLGAAGFPGELVNGERAAGVLRALSDPTEHYLPDPAGAYLPTRAAPYLPTTWLGMTWTVPFVPDQSAVPGRLRLDLDIAGAGYVVEYRGEDSRAYLPVDDDPYLADDAAPYLGGPPPFGPFPGEIRTMRVKYAFRVTTTAAGVRGEVRRAAVVLHGETQEEDINDLVIPPGGVRLPLTKRYHRIRHVAPTLQVDGNGADTIRVIDKNPILGPLVDALANGAPTTALADFRVKGDRA